MGDENRVEYEIDWQANIIPLLGSSIHCQHPLFRSPRGLSKIPAKPGIRLDFLGFLASERGGKWALIKGGAEPCFRGRLAWVPAHFVRGETGLIPGP
jgi:hypothetical protein